MGGRLPGLGRPEACLVSLKASVQEHWNPDHTGCLFLSTVAPEGRPTSDLSKARWDSQSLQIPMLVAFLKKELWVTK